MAEKTTLERAFELTDSGEYSSLRDVHKCLKAEGYNMLQLSGRALTRQLKARMRAALRAPLADVAAPLAALTKSAKAR